MSPTEGNPVKDKVHYFANTRCTWAGGTYLNYPDFFENHQFHVIHCVILAHVFFEEF